MKTSIFLSFLFVIRSIAGFAQQTFPENAVMYISQLANYQKFMGVIAVSKNGELQLNEPAGLADVENNVPVQPNTKFRIGSISKTFTSVLVLKAVEEGKLKLDDKLSVYLPQIRNSGTITIEQMLRHRSGIYSVTSAVDYLAWCTTPQTRDQLIAIIQKNQPAFEPDAKSEYSNSNYILLTFILEDLYGKTYAALLSEKIAQPLGLNDTYVGGKIDIQKNEAYSYRFAGKWEKENETDMSVPRGAGAVVSNTRDLITFIEALFAGKLITQSSLDKMTEMKDRTGLGMFQFPFEENEGFGHSGGIDGFRSVLVHYPGEKVTFCYLTNGLNYNKNDMSYAILSYAFGKPYELPSFETVAVKQSVLKKYTGEYTSADFPGTIRIFIENDQLMGQASGQGPFLLEASNPTTFRNDMAGVKMVFDAKQRAFTMTQGGRTLQFKK